VTTIGNPGQLSRGFLPQIYCSQLTDHDAHYEYHVCGVAGEFLAVRYIPESHCPGRYTPRLHGGISGDPTPGWTEADPFAGLD
jgi:hypothetical protein